MQQHLAVGQQCGFCHNQVIVAGCFQIASQGDIGTDADVHRPTYPLILQHKADEAALWVQAHAQFSDVVFKNCDLSNVNLTECGFHRVEFTGCKLMGTNMSDGTFNHITFDECRGEYMNLSMSKMRYIQFTRSNLQGAGIEGCQLMNVSFDACNLMEAEFYRTSLKGIDLSNSEISGIRITNLANNELRGSSVSSLQALELARMLGVEIRD